MSGDPSPGWDREGRGERIKKSDYNFIVSGFWSETENFDFDFAKKTKDSMQKSVSRGAERRKFQLHSTFQ